MILLSFIVLILILIYFFEKEKKWLWSQIRSARSLLDMLSLQSKANTLMRSAQDVILEPVFVPKKNMDRILILKLDHIGDIILTIPAMRAIRQKWPSAEITLVAGWWARSLLEAENLVDVFIDSEILQQGLSKKAKSNALKHFKRSINGKSFDLAVDLRVFGDTAYLLAHVDATIKLFSRTVDSLDVAGFGVLVPPTLHIADKTSYITQKIGCDPVSNRPQLVLTENELLDAKKYVSSLNVDGPLIGIHPFSSVETRNWGTSNYVQLASLLVARTNANCIFFLGSEKLDGIDALPDHAKNKIHVAQGKTLRESAAIMSQCDVFVGNNSGPMHIAASVGTRVVAVFSGTEMSWEWGPATDNARVIYVDLPCIRCHQSHCAHLTCLTSISVEQVAKTVTQELLAR